MIRKLLYIINQTRPILKFGLMVLILLFCLTSSLELVVVKLIEEFLKINSNTIEFNIIGISFSWGIQKMLFVFLGVIGLKFCSELCLNYAINKLSYVFQNSILHTLLPRFIYAFDPKISIEKKLNLLLIETRNLSHFLIKPLIKLTYTVILSGILIIYLIQLISIDLLLYTAIIGLLSLVIINLILSQSKKSGKKSGELREVNMNLLADILNGSFEIRYFDAVETFKKTFFKSFHRQLQAELSKDISSNLFKPIIETILLISFILLIYSSVNANETIDFARLGVILFLMLKIITLVQQFTSSYANVKFYSKSLDIVYTEFCKKSSLEAIYSPTQSDQHIFELDKFNFGYGSKNIFKDLTLNIEKGQIYYLKGASGIGKSTLLNLLSGNIACEGIKLNSNYTSNDILYLRQDPHLFEMSLQDNASMLNDKLDSEVIQTNLKKINLDHQIKLQDSIGPRGSIISGGQKQKVNLLRLLLKRKPIILLDEVFNSIDKKTRDVIFNYIIETKPDLVIFVSHDEDLEKFSTGVIEMISS